MTSLFDEMIRGATQLRLRTLVRLRWLAVLGQSAAVVFVWLGLGYDLPVAPCFALIALSAWLNIYLELRRQGSRELAAGPASGLLAYDVVQLACLLALTGGLANPFAILLLVPVVVSASALPPANTALLGVLTIVSATLIAFVHLPLPWAGGREPNLPQLYLLGIWVALASSLAFMSLYAFRVAEEARQMSDALSAAELVLVREQHLSALDGMAAAAAHELGTPLATIALVSRELERELPADSPHGEDIRLLRSQVERCRRILERIGSLGDAHDGPLDRMSLRGIIEEIAEPHREFGVAIAVELDGTPPDPVVRRNAAVLYGLGNLVENAVDFARGEVQIAARWDGEDVLVEILDDGPGFSPEVLAKIGEPYLTTRGRRRGGIEESGLGLGLFIAKTLLERTGARLSFANRDGGRGGAAVRVVWPRARFDVSAQTREGAGTLASARADDMKGGQTHAATAP